MPTRGATPIHNAGRGHCRYRTLPPQLSGLHRAGGRSHHDQRSVGRQRYYTTAAARGGGGCGDHPADAPRPPQDPARVPLVCTRGLRVGSERDGRLGTGGRSATPRVCVEARVWGSGSSGAWGGGKGGQRRWWCGPISYKKMVRVGPPSRACSVDDRGEDWARGEVAHPPRRGHTRRPILGGRRCGLPAPHTREDAVEKMAASPPTIPHYIVVHWSATARSVRGHSVGEWAPWRQAGGYRHRHTMTATVNGTPFDREACAVVRLLSWVNCGEKSYRPMGCPLRVPVVTH